MCYFKASKFKANQAENDLAFTFDETIWMGGNPMICIQNKRGTGRAILLTLFLAFLLPVSYTHLDVYKRQVCALSTAGFTGRR